MEFSKLKIIKVAKDEIRRKFFESRSANSGKKVDVLDASDQKMDADSKSNVKQLSEKEVGLTVVPRVEEASVNEHDGFPMITSVFSLADNEKTDEIGGFSNSVCLSRKNTTNTQVKLENSAYTTSSSNDVPVSNLKKLPFVVRCSPSGFITVSSPPKSTSSSSKCSKDRNDSTTLTPSVTSTMCAPKSCGKTLITTVPNQFPSTIISSYPSIVTFIDATQLTGSTLEKPSTTVSYMQSPISSVKTASSVTNVEISSESAEVKSLQTDIKCLDKTETSFVALVSTNDVADSNNETNQIKADSCCNGKEEDTATHLNSQHHAINDQKGSAELPCEEDNLTHSIPTKQDEKIRKLKNLLRQKEAELEKFRFKTQTGSHSPAAKLRANFLKKNPFFCKRSPRLNSKETTESNTHVSSPATSTNESAEADVSDNKELTRKNTTGVGVQLCASEQQSRSKNEVRSSRTSLNRASSKFTDQDKYKLVDVTVVQGHTRTLAVPLKTDCNAAGSMRNKQNSPSMCCDVFKTSARKRKQQLPKKVGSTPAKQKSIKEDDLNNREGIESKFGKILNPASSSNASMLHGSDDIVSTRPTRSSPRKTERQPSLKAAAAKRKSPNDNVLDIQNGTSVPKKAAKTDTSPCQTDSEPSCSLRCSKTESALKAALGIDSIATSKRLSTDLSATINIVTETLNNVSSYVEKDAKQITTNSQSSTGKDVAKTSAKILGSFVTSDKELTKCVLAKVSEEDNSVSKKDSNTMKNSSIAGDLITTNSPQVFIRSQMTNSVTDSMTTSVKDVMANTTSNNLVKTPANTTFNRQTTAVGESPNEQRTSSNCIGNSMKVLTVNTVTSQVTCVPTTWIPTPWCPKPCTSVTFVPTSNYTLTTISLSTPLASSGTLNLCATSAKNTAISIIRPIAPRSEASQYSTLPRFIAPKPAHSLHKPCTGISRVPTSIISKPATNVSPKPAPTISTSSNIASKLAPSGILSKPVPILSRPTTEILSKKATSISPNPAPVSLTPLPKSTAPQTTSAKPILTQWRLSKPTPTLPISIPSKCIPLKSAALKTISIAAYTTPQTPSSHSVATKPKMVQCTSPSVIPSTTLAQNITTKVTTFPPLNQVISISPKPVVSVPTTSPTTFSESLSSGKILVYDVVQSNQAQQSGSLPIGSKESAKLVVHVSNKGESRHLGIIKDNKIYVNTNQVPIQPQLKSPATTSNTEFIPNPQDAEFKALLGLDHVVTLLT